MTLLDNNIGGVLEIEQTGSQLDFKIKIRMDKFAFIKGNKIYTLQGTVGSKKAETDLAIEIQKYSYVL